jgi:CO dehydrogenase/acetyl-CoA synthase delta subunit
MEAVAATAAGRRLQDGGARGTVCISSGETANFPFERPRCAVSAVPLSSTGGPFCRLLHIPLSFPHTLPHHQTRSIDQV